MVHVIMQSQREWPADICIIPGKLFAKGKEGLSESKLRVSYAQPAPPPTGARGRGGRREGENGTSSRAPASRVETNESTRTMSSDSGPESAHAEDSSAIS